MARGKKKKTDNSSVKLTKLTPEIISNTWLHSVDIVDDGHIEFTQSWEELILNMIGMSIKYYGKDAIIKLLKARIISANVMVETRPINKFEPSEPKTKIFEIPGSGYYIGLKRDCESYCKAVKGLAALMNKKSKDITLNIQCIDPNKPIDSVQLHSIKKPLTQLLDTDLSSVKVESVEIMGNMESVKSITQAFQLISIWAITIYGDGFVQAAFNNSMAEVGITIISEIDKYDTRFSTYKLEDYYIYNSNNTNAVIRYLINTLMETGLSPDLIEIGYKYIG